MRTPRAGDAPTWNCGGRCAHLGTAADVIETDWSVFFVATPTVSFIENALLVIFAYALQFFLLLVFVLFIPISSAPSAERSPARGTGAIEEVGP